ncbi:hypothetical protein BHM03_00045504 [Ensete ventricosum]|uniref:Uncharacterized protein n=1 Tax=Ensete ventricosum TaxID=4639 RepID=A0A445MKT5_ENSVE|nr:hypothetical protein BHM03_00045504 [Ensete ventricosum]
MRLNRVELFYALVVANGSESRRCLRGRGNHMHVVCMQRWLAMARPPAGAVNHGLATCNGRPATARPPARGDRLRPGPLQGAAACRGSSSQGVATRGHDRLWQARRGDRLWPARRGNCQRPARKGQSATVSPAASRGDNASRMGGCPLAGRLPAAKGNRRLRMGSGGDDTIRVKEG